MAGYALWRGWPGKSKRSPWSTTHGSTVSTLVLNGLHLAPVDPAVSGLATFWCMLLIQIGF